MRRTGESKAHEKQKERIGQVLRDYGFTVHVDSYPLECKTEKGERIYWPDVYAQNFCFYPLRPNTSATISNGAKLQSGGLRVVAEVLGSKGKGNHSTPRRRDSDEARRRNIYEQNGPFYFVELWDWQLRGLNDFEIWQEIEWQLSNQAELFPELFTSSSS